jgi:competence protein ComEC
MAREAATLREYSAISVFIAGFAAGIFISSFVPIVPLVSLLVAAVALAMLLAEKLQGGVVPREVFLAALFVAAASFGSFRYAIKDFHEVVPPALAGVVVDEPADAENARRFVYEAENGERVLVSAPLYAPVSYGDRVRVSGKLSRPGVIAEGDGRAFDYGAYLAKDDIYWTMSFADVEVLAHGEGSALKTALFAAKQDFVSHIESILPEPQASLLAGLVIAGKGSLPSRVLEDFRRSGVVHIVVLSGFNVTLIAEFLRQLCTYAFLAAGLAAAPLALAASALGIALFVLMTGASATVVRAAAMALIALLAKHLGRSFSAPRALALAAFLMLMWNPKLLVFDPSFQLSFLATLGLVYVSPWLEERLRGRWARSAKLKEIFIQTASTQLAVLPLLMYSTGSVSLVSLPANLAILPAVPLAMLTGFFAALASYLSPVLAWPVSFLAHALLSFILGAARLFGSLPFAVVAVPQAGVWLAALLPLGLAGLAFVLRRKLVYDGGRHAKEFR